MANFENGPFEYIKYHSQFRLVWFGFILFPVVVFCSFARISFLPSTPIAQCFSLSLIERWFFSASATCQYKYKYTNTIQQNLLSLYISLFVHARCACAFVDVFILTYFFSIGHSIHTQTHSNPFVRAKTWHYTLSVQVYFRFVFIWNICIICVLGVFAVMLETGLDRCERLCKRDNKPHPYPFELPQMKDASHKSLKIYCVRVCAAA